MTKRFNLDMLHWPLRLLRAFLQQTRIDEGYNVDHDDGDGNNKGENSFDNFQSVD